MSAKILKFQTKAERAPAVEPEINLEEVPYDEIFLTPDMSPEEIAQSIAGMFTEEEIVTIREYFEREPEDEEPPSEG